MVMEPIAGLPKRSEVVAVKLPGTDSLFALRVVALPGEQVAFDDGYPVIDNVKRTDLVQWIPPRMTGWSSFPKWGQVLKVPSASYYVLADNHGEGAVDSLTHGAVPRSSIAGALSTWDEVLHEPGRMKAVFGRAFKDMSSRLPINSDGWQLVDIEILDDLDLRFTYRTSAPGTEVDRAALQDAACQTNWFNQANGLRLRYRVMAGTNTRFETMIEQSACHGKR